MSHIELVIIQKLAVHCSMVNLSAGGYDKILHTDRASMECFDPDTQEWTFTAEMEKARSGLALVAMDHFIYAFGGRFRPTDQYFDLVERWVYF